MVLKVYGKHVSRAADYQVDIPIVDGTGSDLGATMGATTERPTEWRRGLSNYHALTSCHY
jgi:hypothetical protein